MGKCDWNPDTHWFKTLLWGLRAQEDSPDVGLPEDATELADALVLADRPGKRYIHGRD